MSTKRAALYSGHRYPAAVIAQAVWLSFRFPLSLRMVEEMLAERGIMVSHETIRRWGRKFGGAYAAEIRRRQAATGDKWHLDEVVISIRGETHWLWRAVDQHGVVLDILVQSRRDARYCNLTSGNSFGDGAVSPCRGRPRQGRSILVFHGIATPPWRQANGRAEG